MPELPEVETVVLGLREFLIGHRIQQIETTWSKTLRFSQPDMARFVLKAQIVGLGRRGKVILIDLHTKFTLLVHLKMTGQLVYRQSTLANKMNKNFGAGHPSDSLIRDLPDKTTRVIFTLDKDSFLFFNDMRKFGWIKLVYTNNLGREASISQLGPDALSISPPEFARRLASRQKCIKACLLDQTILAGCGNIYADESLFGAKIHPLSRAKDLNSKQVQALWHSLREVLQLSLQQGGSSSRNYVNATGLRGQYLNFVKVYQRAGQACGRCGSEIQRILAAGRGSYICLNCQKRLEC